jgi:hypothetical protein
MADSVGADSGNTDIWMGREIDRDPGSNDLDFAAWGGGGPCGRGSDREGFAFAVGCWIVPRRS